MDQLEKTSTAQTRRYNEFPRPPADQREKALSEAVLTAPVPVPALETDPAAKRIWFFEDGSGDMKDLLGGKGAGLAEMTRAGLPVPPGFTITTEVCLAYQDAGPPLPGRAGGRNSGRDERARAPPGQGLRQAGQPAAGLGPLAAPGSRCRA